MLCQHILATACAGPFDADELYVEVKTAGPYATLTKAEFDACVDFVVAGATLHDDAKNVPDIVSPILHGKPVLVGPAHRQLPIIAAAINAGVVLDGIDNEQLFTHIRTLIDDPTHAAQVAQRARDWLNLQVGAMGRVLAWIK